MPEEYRLKPVRKQIFEPVNFEAGGHNYKLDLVYQNHRKIDKLREKQRSRQRSPSGLACIKESRRRRVENQNPAIRGQ